MKIVKILTYLSLALSILTLMGCDRQSSNVKIIPMDKKKIAAADAQPKGTKKVLCPLTSELIKDPDTQRWSTANGWKSYDDSFSTKLTHFYGAQWNGAGIGQVFCLYKDDNPESFYVLLAYHTLALEPQSHNWSALEGNKRNCVNSQQQQCPFYVKLPTKKPDFYDDIKSLRQPQ